MTGAKGPSMSWSDFIRAVPNGAWVRQVKGETFAGLDLPIEGIVLFDDVDEIKATKVADHTLIKVTPTTSLETVVLYAGCTEYKIGDAWIDFRELCIRTTERRLAETWGHAVTEAVDPHPFQWMTHPDELNMSIEQIGAQLYSAASWIEANGNKGYSDDDLMKALPALRIRLLDNAYRLTWENILFFGDGSRKRDFAGWGVHKYKPVHWTVTWLERFGATHPQAQTLAEAVWDEAHAAHAKRAVKRSVESYLSIDLEQEPTPSIAHKAAGMWLLSKWAQQRCWRHFEAREMWLMQSRLYQSAYEIFRQELLYRMDQQPAPRRSKKKTQSVRDDWATANRYFDATRGIDVRGFRADGFDLRRFDVHTFYTDAYITACCESDSVPDTHVDFDHLPRGLQEAVDVRAVDAAIDADESEEV